MKETNAIPRGVSALFRLLFAVIFAVTGFLLGRELELHVVSLHVANGSAQIFFRFATPVAGALLGVGVSPIAQRLFERDLVLLESASEYLSGPELVGAVAGFGTGLVGSILLRILFDPVLRIAGDAGEAVTVLVAVVLCAASTYIGLRAASRERRGMLSKSERGSSDKILDTSAIIDGRIVDVWKTGFLEGKIVVPRFVLGELQNIADSADPGRRMRGRRGLELLNELRAATTVEVYDDPNEAVEAGLEVDARLVKLARERAGKLVTGDFNLNRVAGVEGVGVLNVNELAQALRPVLQPGQELTVEITRDGREANQGVAYLEDGTMIVVENGRSRKGSEVEVLVTSVIQTAAGRMIFAKLR